MRVCLFIILLSISPVLQLSAQGRIEIPDTALVKVVSPDSSIHFAHLEDSLGFCSALKSAWGTYLTSHPKYRHSLHRLLKNVKANSPSLYCCLRTIISASGECTVLSGFLNNEADSIAMRVFRSTLVHSKWLPKFKEGHNSKAIIQATNEIICFDVNSKGIFSINIKDLDVMGYPFLRIYF